MADDTFPADRSVQVFFTHTAPDGKRTHLGFVTELTVGGDPVEVVRVVLSLKVDDGMNSEFMVLTRDDDGGWTTNASSTGRHALVSQGEYMPSLRQFEGDVAHFEASVVHVGFLSSYYLTTYMARQQAAFAPNPEASERVATSALVNEMSKWEVLVN